jgi:hypothetical protein
MSIESDAARFKQALREILDEVRKPPYTVSGRKAWIRDVCEVALRLEWEDLPCDYADRYWWHGPGWAPHLRLWPETKHLGGQ